MWHMYDGWGGGWGYGFGMGFGWIVPLVVLGFLIWIGVSLARMAAARRGSPREDNAVAILRERYARGEIDRETFEAMKRDLR